jgi:tRNA A-37 threonylcarbamoyl transferase component Bud32
MQDFYELVIQTTPSGHTAHFSFWRNATAEEIFGVFIKLGGIGSEPVTLAQNILTQFESIILPVEGDLFKTLATSGLTFDVEISSIGSEEGVNNSSAASNGEDYIAQPSKNPQLLKITLENLESEINAAKNRMAHLQQNLGTTYEERAKSTDLVQSERKIFQSLVIKYELIKSNKERISKILTDINTTLSLRNITKLGLNPRHESLLHKALELRHYASNITPSDELLAAIELIEQNKISEFFDLEGIEEEINKAFLLLADIKDLAPEVRQTLEKLYSAKQRERTSEELLSLLKNKSLSLEDKTALLSNIFIKEYRQMTSVLQLDETGMRHLEGQILSMARDYVQLASLIQAAKPIITAEQTEAYFHLLQKIAQQIAPDTFHNFHFKIPHSKKGVLKIVLTKSDGVTQVIELYLHEALPFSLVKPPGDNECYISFGGSRGIIAPFKEIDVLYSPAKRFFTHGRLQFGQYATVKLLQGIVSHCPAVIKKTYIDKSIPLFTERDRQNPLTRLITARPDPKARLEYDVLKHIQKSMSNTNGLTKLLSPDISYWTSMKKSDGRIFTEDPQEQHIITHRVPGHSMADIAGRYLSNKSKGAIEYHNPIARASVNTNFIHELRNRITLAKQLVDLVNAFTKAGFAHNDIKPENLLIGSEGPQFVDFATAGFIRHYEGNSRNLQAIFQEQFSVEGTPTFNKEKNEYSDSNGRFVRQEGNEILFGINPRLPILHDAKSCTPAYLSAHRVLGASKKRPLSPTDTVLKGNEESLDKGALTALIFGVTNRLGYFELTRGRIIPMYVVPDIMERDHVAMLPGLTVVNWEKFNQFFACRETDCFNPFDLSANELEANLQAVMYIPGNEQEGEPLHLFRFLNHLKSQLDALPIQPEDKFKLTWRIDNILDQVHQAAAEGIGLTKDTLINALEEIESCFLLYTNFCDESFQQDYDGNNLHRTVLKKYPRESFTFDKFFDLIPLPASMRSTHLDSLRLLELWCLYAEEDSYTKLCGLFQKVITQSELEDKFFSHNASFIHLLQQMIEKNQTILVQNLLQRIDCPSEKFIEYVKSHGILHYAMEKGLLSLVEEILKRLEIAGMSKDQIFALMMSTYGEKQGLAHIQWAGDAFHIALRNYDQELLQIILKYLPSSPDFDSTIYSALQFSADFSSLDLFNQIIHSYNIVHPSTPFNAERIITMPGQTRETPFHNLVDRGQHGVLDSVKKELRVKPELARALLSVRESSLSQTEEGSPSPAWFIALIAASRSNFADLDILFELAESSLESSDQWEELFLQRDKESGYNFLNYYLENNNIVQLHTLIEFILAKCPDSYGEVFTQLLSNPKPVNPLVNYLSANHNFKDHLAVFQLLLNTVCGDFSKQRDAERQQHARLTLLLLNKDWLTLQATDPAHQSDLQQLLLHQGLSLEFQRQLLTQLIASCDNEDAKKYFNLLLSSLAPSTLSNDTPVNIGEITKNIAVINGSIAPFLNEIERLRQENSALATLIEEAQSEAQILGRTLKVKDEDLGRIIQGVQTRESAFYEREFNALPVSESAARESIMASYEEVVSAATLTQTMLATGQQLSESNQIWDAKFKNLERATAAQLTNREQQHALALQAAAGKVETVEARLAELQSEQVKLEQATAQSAVVAAQAKSELEQALANATEHHQAEVARIKEAVETRESAFYERECNALPVSESAARESIMASYEEVVSAATLTQTMLATGQQLSKSNQKWDAKFKGQEQAKAAELANLEQQHALALQAAAGKVETVEARLAELQSEQVKLEQATAQSAVVAAQAKSELEQALANATEHHQAEVARIKEAVETRESAFYERECNALPVSESAARESIMASYEEVVSAATLTQTMLATGQQLSKSNQQWDAKFKGQEQAKAAELANLEQQHALALQAAAGKVETVKVRLAELQSEQVKLEQATAQSAADAAQVKLELEQAMQSKDQQIATLSTKPDVVDARTQASPGVSSSATQAQAPASSSTATQVTDHEEHEATLLKAKQLYVLELGEAQARSVVQERSFTSLLETQSMFKSSHPITEGLEGRLRAIHASIEELRQRQNELRTQNPAHPPISVQSTPLTKTVEAPVRSAAQDESIAKRLAHLEEAQAQLHELMERRALPTRTVGTDPISPSVSEGGTDATDSQKDSADNATSQQKSTLETPEQQNPRRDAQTDAKPLKWSNIAIYSFIGPQRNTMNTENKVILSVNVDRQFLTESELKKFQSQEGLEVSSSSGLTYSFRHCNQIPKAILIAPTAMQLPDEKGEAHYDQLAETIISMINNVLSKSKPNTSLPGNPLTINIRTPDPILASVATLYINKLKQSLPLDSTITLVQADSDAEKTKQLVDRVFDKVKHELDHTALEQMDWFCEAKERQAAAIIPPAATM